MFFIFFMLAVFTLCGFAWWTPWGSGAASARENSSTTSGSKLVAKAAALEVDPSSSLPYGATASEHLGTKNNALYVHLNGLTLRSLPALNTNTFGHFVTRRLSSERVQPKTTCAHDTHLGC